MKQFTNAEGQTYFLPNMDEVKVAIEDQDGFCLACGEIAYGVEPDARRYECESCGKEKVYGAEEFILRGWVDS